ncbi:MAG: glycosyltransferase family 2 protein [Phycisphaerales bacterium]
MPRILIISPCRDEQDHIRACIDSVAAQTVRPTLWIIVDDGSTDRTPEILADAAREHDFIRVVRRDNRGQRSVGPGVIEAFYAGLDAAADPSDSPATHAPDSALSTQHSALPFDFLGKFDADLELPPTYFQRCLDEFDRDPCLGNFSGKVYLRDDDGALTPERMGDENAIGAAKLYRTTCFNDIAGFVRHVGWDGIDGHMCRLKGWVARSADEPDLRIIHRRLMGSSHISVAHGRRRWGLAKWFMGSSLPYMLAVAAYRTLERPYILGGLWILQGYLSAMLARKPRLDTPGFRAHLRRYEWRSLLRGKSRTADDYHARIRAASPRPDSVRNPDARSSASVRAA